MSNCQQELREQGKPYPRTCELCGLFGPCKRQQKLTSFPPTEVEVARALSELGTDHAHVRALIRRLAFHRDKLVTQNATATARVLCYENDVAVHNDTYGSKWYAFNKRTQQYAIRPGVWSDSCGDIGLFDTREDAEQAAVTALTAQSKEGLE